jgi:hypothetical protein
MLSYRDFLDYSEGSYSKAKQASGLGHSSMVENSVIASILLSWIAIESFTNDMMADFAALPPDMFSLPERALLTEQEVEFVNSGSEAGQFRLSGTLKYRPLEDKILFLVAKFGAGTKLDKGGHLWQKFEAVREKRNQISHPRKSHDISLSLTDAEDALEVARAIIKMVSQKVWGKAVDL